jgi:hypothetical protein
MSENNKIQLMDGTEIAVRPLRLSLLKPFLKEFKALEEVSTDDEKSMDILINCIQIALKQYAPELAEDKQKIEDNIDLPTVYKIIDAASGISLSDSASLLTAVPK